MEEMNLNETLDLREEHKKQQEQEESDKTEE